MDTNLPQHIVIIPDGNRRWAKSKGLNPIDGHKAGLENTFKLIEKANDLGIKYMTFWGFSTENYKREQDEVNYLFEDIFYQGALRYVKKIEEYKAGFRHIGRKDRMPVKLRELFEDVENRTKDSKDKIISFAIDYGGRDEIVRAVKKIVGSGVSVDDINEELISSNLDTAGIPDPDIVIRTSGEKRLSGYLPWQTVYSELFFVDDPYPEFTENKLQDIIELFSQRIRRFGGNSK